MKVNNIHFAWLLFAVVSFVSINGLIDINDSWEKKIKAQRRNNYQVTTSQQQWHELTEFRSGWQRYFEEEKSGSNSRHELYKSLRLEQGGLNPVRSSVINSESENLIHNGNQIGLKRTCVGNTTVGLEVVGENIRDLLNSLKSIQDRQSVIFGDITLVNKKGFPDVVIRDFCVLFRLRGEAG